MTISILDDCFFDGLETRHTRPLFFFPSLFSLLLFLSFLFFLLSLSNSSRPRSYRIRPLHLPCSLPPVSCQVSFVEARLNRIHHITYDSASSALILPLPPPPLYQRQCCAPHLRYDPCSIFPHARIHVYLVSGWSPYTGQSRVLLHELETKSTVTRRHQQYSSSTIQPRAITKSCIPDD